MNSENFLELSQLQSLIQIRIGVMEQWVRAEIESCSCSRGHYYLNLIERGEDGGIAARAQATVWASQSGILEEFEELTGRKIGKGLSIVVKAKVNYHPVYGLSLNIFDIDSNFTIGQRELERRATIARLEKEGCMEMQKELCLPFLPTRMAIISSETAAGYGDFINHLEQNDRGYRFNYTLFQSVMQGDASPASIIENLEKIGNEYDLVLIFRGGGADADMFCFDDYDLARSIAECPIPVLTAIGHERDFHVADMVAHDHYKTPTALADRIIDWYDSVEQQLADSLGAVLDALYERLDQMDREVSRCVSTICLAATSAINKLENEVTLAQTRINAADPRSILQQGYVLAVNSKGKILKNVNSASKGDDFSLRFKDGSWKCEVKDVIKYDERRLHKETKPSQGDRGDG